MILVCTRDPGGTRAILPALPSLSGRFALEILGLKFSEKLYRDAGWNVSTLADYSVSDLSPESMAKLLQVSGAGAILTASTDWRQSDSIEPRLVAAARKLGIPSVGVLDHICNLSERFGLGHAWSETTFLPDLLCVPHPTAIDRLMELGVERSRLALTGYAWLDGLNAGRQDQVARGDVARVADLFGKRDFHLVCLFAGELMTEASLAGGAEWYGFDENTTLDALIPRLRSHCRMLDRNIHLILKPHPKDNSLGKYLCRTEEGKGLTVSMSPGELDRNLLLEYCDVVFGMTSMILLDSVCLGRPTVSLQLGLRREDVVVTNECGASLPIYNTTTLDTELDLILTSPDRRKELAALTRNFDNDGRSTERLVDSVTKFLSVRGVS